MARESKAAKEVRIHREALRSFNRIQTATRDDRLLSREDRRICDIAGAQWEGPLLQQFANKPRFEINKIKGAVVRLEGEHRNNRHSVDFLPADGSPADDFADVCDSLFRADEADSNADEAHDNAFSEAIRGGYGAARLRAVKEDEYDDENDHQRIRVEPINDADTSVYWDLNSKRQDKADAMFCFVVTAIDRDAYKAQYLDDPSEWGKDESSWPKTTDYAPLFRDWYTPDVVYVAEYYRVEESKERVFVFKSITGDEIEKTAEEMEIDDEEDEREEGERTQMEIMLATGHELVRERTRKRRRVHKWIMSGGGVLEDCGFIAGPRIPIAMCYGSRVFIDNKERWSGHVRIAKDPQRVTNMLVSRLAEISALSTVSKPIFAPEQIDPFQREWQTDNVENYAYLRANPIMSPDGSMAVQGPIGYTKPPEVPPALAGLLQVMSVDIKDLLGNMEQKDKVVSNISGKAVEMFQASIDVQAVVYLDNFKKYMRSVGEIWLGMAAELYVEDGRVMKLIGANGERSSITLGQPTATDDGLLLREGVLDWKRAKMDVVVDVGPQTATKKAATVRALTGLLAIVPESDQQTRSVLTSSALANMEGEGLKDINAYYRKQLVMAGVIPPSKEEEQEIAQAKQAAANKPDPNAQALQAVAVKEQALAQKAQADTVKSMAETELTRAKVKETEARTLETVAKVDRDTSTPPQAPVDRRPPPR